MSEKQRSAGTVLGAVALLIVTGCDDGIGPAGSANLAVEDQIQLPDGFHISLWADNIVRPRSLALGAWARSSSAATSSRRV
ncbi:MAG: hypothetical protein VX815_13855 [Gemmatimonadota bacterium]|nr:hypothetical protein [Gemmatimonadota bacterium]